MRLLDSVLRFATGISIAEQTARRLETGQNTNGPVASYLEIETDDGGHLRVLKFSDNSCLLSNIADEETLYVAGMSGDQINIVRTVKGAYKSLEGAIK